MEQSARIVSSELSNLGEGEIYTKIMAWSIKAKRQEIIKDIFDDKLSSSISEGIKALAEVSEN